MRMALIFILIAWTGTSFAQEKLNNTIKPQASSEKQKTEAEQSGGEERTAIDRGIKKFTGLTALATFLLFVAASIQVGLFWWQLRLIRSSLADTKSAAEAAKKSAEIAERTVITMKDTAERQLRAHVFVEMGYIGNVADPLPTYTGVPSPNPAAINFPTVGPIVNLRIKNFGQTPAYEVIHWTFIPIIREYPLNPQTPLPKRQRVPGAPITKMTLGPGGIIIKNIRMNAQLTAQEIDDLRNGSKAIYIWGIIVYKDVFKKWHRTRYRMMHVVHGGAIGLSTDLTGYGEGNDAT